MPNPSNNPPPPPPPPPPMVRQPPRERTCAACKHQRKKCLDMCIFAPYFPPGLAREFDRAQKVFGVSNMAKMAGKIPVGLRRVFFESIVCEAELRYANPVTGCTGQLERLRRQNHELRHEVEVLRQKVRMHESFCPNGNGFVNYNCNQQRDDDYVNLHGNGVGMGLSNGNSNGIGFPLNGVVFCNGLEPALSNGERARRSVSPYTEQDDKRN